MTILKKIWNTIRYGLVLNMFRYKLRSIGIEISPFYWTEEGAGTKGHLCPYPLRWIGYRDSETKKHYVFLTNDFTLFAKTIANIYKERWQIEIFFRWIKQNLKIKAFIANSHNSVMTQIYVALIAHLLLCIFKYLSKASASLQNLVRAIQLDLFRKCSLEELFKLLPKAVIKNYNNKQLKLNFA